MNGGEAEVPLLLPPQLPHKWEEKIRGKNLRNSVALSFMLIHFSTGKLYTGLPYT